MRGLRVRYSKIIIGIFYFISTSTNFIRGTQSPKFRSEYCAVIALTLFIAHYVTLYDRFMSLDRSMSRDL